MIPLRSIQLEQDTALSSLLTATHALHKLCKPHLEGENALVVRPDVADGIVIGIDVGRPH